VRFAQTSRGPRRTPTIVDRRRASKHTYASWRTYFYGQRGSGGGPPSRGEVRFSLRTPARASTFAFSLSQVLTASSRLPRGKAAAHWTKRGRIARRRPSPRRESMPAASLAGFLGQKGRCGFGNAVTSAGQYQGERRPLKLSDVGSRPSLRLRPSADCARSTPGRPRHPMRRNPSLAPKGRLEAAELL